MNIKLNEKAMADSELEKVSGGTGGSKGFFQEIDNEVVSSLGDGVFYVVEEGDTLKSIADRHGMTVRDLFVLNSETIIQTANENGIICDDPSGYVNYIFAGMTLRLA